VPLLIGGATTSRAHTAIKIAPAYSKPVVHVLDASRAVGVVSSLLSPDQKAAFAEQNRCEQEQLREQHANRRQERAMLPIAEARRRRVSIEWRAEDIPSPSVRGICTFEDMPLETLARYIDWSPFFHTWELRGRYPAILEDPVVGEAAREVFEDAQKMLDWIVREKKLKARGVYGLFPANAVGDDVEVYCDESRSNLITRFHFLRQQMDKGDEQVNYCLADFIAPKETGLPDHIGGFAVTAGIGLRELVEEFKSNHDDHSAIMVEALADRLAEAFAECAHELVRHQWGYDTKPLIQDESKLEDLIRERYRGIRPAAGYPACPDHTEKQTLFDLLQVDHFAEGSIKLTESFAMYPASSVSGLYFAHPMSRYFPVGKIERDQVEDYAARKGWTVAEVERWLAPNLNYEP
jgi:5-methyltetrahydrofolate--homocysteine methyltransferase